MNTLLLFDLDGTLVISEGAGRRAIIRAFGTLYGSGSDWASLNTAGRTDTAIFAAMLCEIGRDPAEAWSPALWETYFRFLEDEVGRRPGRLAPGVRELLDYCRPARGLFAALGTGNLERGARIKLEPHGINDRLPVGGFGSDAAVRAELVRIGALRAGAHYGVRFDRVVVVGDTPLDAECARENGFGAVLVGTGPYSVDALERCGAAAVLPDLRDTGRVLEAVEQAAGASAGPGPAGADSGQGLGEAAG
ncbi:MAG: haloacid dehalogenase-like hydrolase [Firmicutes bacterium]|nr:haloacid dehalogenase-like hydrolase [Bacillota bacterium]